MIEQMFYYAGISDGTAYMVTITFTGIGVKIASPAAKFRQPF
jgi:hypothetical protein